MDPTNVLASQTTHHHDADKAGPAEVSAFYDRHGLELFAILSRWRSRLAAAPQWIRGQTGSTVDFAPRGQGS